MALRIQHTQVLIYLLFMQEANNICSWLSSEDAFDTHFSTAVFQQGQVALSSALLKASDVFFLFYLMEIYHHEAVESSIRTALVQSTG